jgi:hypothetical protein
MINLRDGVAYLDKNNKMKWRGMKWGTHGVSHHTALFNPCTIPQDEEFYTLDSSFYNIVGIVKHSSDPKKDKTLSVFGTKPHCGGDTDALPWGKFSKVSLGGYSGCAVKDGPPTVGNIECWGFAAKHNRVMMGEIPPFKFVDVDVGFVHACGLTTGGKIVCWGFDSKTVWEYPECPGSTASHRIAFTNGSPMGMKDADWKTKPSGTSYTVSRASNFVSVSLSSYSACATTNDGGKGICWGWEALLKPSIKKSLKDGNLQSVAMSQSNEGGLICTLNLNGKVVCDGHLADYLYDGRLPGTSVLETHRFKKIGLGFMHACGLTLDKQREKTVGCFCEENCQLF